MADDKFMLVSLKEDQAKKVAQVLSNPTSTKIIDELTRGEKTESELSEKLNLPLSTVHYNLQQLLKAKLVVVEEFHYSKKGKEVNHYKLANKYIIIAPQEEKEGLLSRLKGILPVALVTLGAAFALKASQIFARLSSAGSPTESSVAMYAMEQITEETADTMMRTMAVDMAEKSTNETLSVVTQNMPVVYQVPWWQSAMVDWAILGALAVLVILVLVEIIKYRRDSK